MADALACKKDMDSLTELVNYLISAFSNVKEPNFDGFIGMVLVVSLYQGIKSIKKLEER